MKKYILANFLFLSVSVFAQQSSLDAINIKRDKIARDGVKVLAAFSAANILYGGIASGSTNGSTKYFHEMNAIWNGVTLGITALGYFTSKKPGTLSLAQSLGKQQSVERLFLFNAGLDLAYIAGGAYLQEKGKTSLKNADKLNGYGRSIMVQGGALLLFDGIMYSLQHKNGKALNKLTEKISLASTGNGIGLLVHLI